MNEINIALANMYEKNQGVTNVALKYKEALDNSGYRVTFIQFSFKPEENFISPSQKGFNLFSRKLSKAFNILFTFPRKLSKINAEMVILSDPWLLKAAKYNNNCVLIFHDCRQLTKYSDGVASKLLFKHLLKYISRVLAIIAVSDRTKEELIHIGVKRSKIYVIKNSYESPKNLIHKKLMRTNRLQKTALNVYYVASDQRHKNVFFFLELAKKMLIIDKVKNINFYLVSNISANKVKVYKPLLEKGLRILKCVPDISDFLVDMDLLIFPSNYEGFGLPLIEAISLGIPVISKDLPITREVLGNSGIFLKELTLNEWVREILKFRNIEYYNKFSKLSLDRSTIFSFSQFTKNVNDVFEHIYDSKV